MIAIIDFGGQYVQNIRRCFLELGYRAEIFSPESIPENVDGVVLSGGPASVYEGEAPRVSGGILELGVPVLGICYGHQLLAQMLGGKVERGRGEYGFAELEMVKRDPIFKGFSNREICWMSHRDCVTKTPGEVLARTEKTQIAAFRFGKIYGVQFHPEVSHTPKGYVLLRNFAKLCRAERISWSVRKFLKEKEGEIKKIKGKVLVAVSGGVDSATLLFFARRLMGRRVVGLHIDTGFMRKGESRWVGKKLGVNVVDRKKIFLKALEGVRNYDERRRIIGELFVREFEKFARRMGIDHFMQGTIAPDVIESTRGSSKGKGCIKLHHNVGGMPESVSLNVIEPFRELFKYQVRELARFLGVPPEIRKRQPFPGPGLACRITCEITPERIELLREVTEVVERELSRYGADQYFAALASAEIEKEECEDYRIIVLRDRAVGVKGDERVLGSIAFVEIPEIERKRWVELLKLQGKLTEGDVVRVVALLHEGEGEHSLILRAVNTRDFMTAIPARVNFKHLKTLARKLGDYGMRFVGYEITTKPPATIELI